MRAMLATMIVLGGTQPCWADCEGERQAVVGTLSDKVANDRARAVFKACIDHEAAAGDPNCIAADEVLSDAAYKQRHAGMQDDAAYSAATKAATECHDRVDKSTNTPARAGVVVSAAICACRQFLKEVRHGEASAKAEGTLHGKLRAENWAWNIPRYTKAIARLQRQARVEHLKVAGCDAKNLGKLALCLAHPGSEEDCGPSADVYDDAESAMQLAIDPPPPENGSQ